MLEKITQIFRIKELRDKILFIVGMLVVFRILATIPLPGVNSEQLKQLFEGNQFLGMLNIFSGGGLNNISIVLLGVGPYITASIIMQLLTMIIPRVGQLYKEEGEAGRQKFNMITRWLTVPLAAVQVFAMISLLKSQGILGQLDVLATVALVIVAVAGTLFLMWLGELITEKGIGNGVSLIIFAGIVASLPGSISQLFVSFDSSLFTTYLLMFIVVLVTIAGVVVVSEGQRNIEVSYAKRMRGGQMMGGSNTHLPLRVNQAGVIPIIFAMSIMLFPGMIATFLMRLENHPEIVKVATAVNTLFQNQLFYGLAYFILIVLFTYFYTAVVFDPTKIAENLQKQGGYIPGIRPGNNTTDYLYRVMNRITLAGSLFLGLIAVLPLAMRSFTGIQSLAIGGTSVLIVVSVVIETIKQIEGQLVMRDYEGF